LLTLPQARPKVTPAQQHHAPLTRDGGCEAARLSVNVPSQRRQDKKCGNLVSDHILLQARVETLSRSNFKFGDFPHQPPEPCAIVNLLPTSTGRHQGAFSNIILLDHLIRLHNRSHGGYPLGPRLRLTRHLHFGQTSSATLISNAANVSKTNPRSHNFVVVSVYSYTE
jgi:hypothetical protein